MSDQPGEVNTPADTHDEGPVDLSDRSGPEASGSPGANQRSDEHVDPDPPDLGSMNVGVGDPQAPSHPAAGDRWVHGGGDVSDSPEEQDTDVVASTAAMADGSGLSGVGDPQSVPVPSHDAAPGTAEERGVTQGARTPS